MRNGNRPESQWDGSSATGVETERNGGELFFFSRVMPVGCETDK